MKKRFKTKQELHKDYPGSSVSRYGEPPNLHDKIYFLDVAFTTTPHPYEGKDVIIRIETPNESEAVQKKMFALGYKWVSVGMNVREDIWLNDLMIQNGKLWHNPNGEDYKSCIVLIPQQFLDGDLSGEEWAKVYDAELSDETKAAIAGEAKKPDAYIAFGSHTGHCLCCWDEVTQKECGVSDVRHAHMYNILSEEDFKKKHPGKLRFKEWDVEKFDGHVRIGCVTFQKKSLEYFRRTYSTILENDVSVTDAYNFLETHRKELGLDF